MQHHRLVLFPFRLIFLRSVSSDFICFICRHSKLIWFIPRFMPVSAENYSFTYLMLFNIIWNKHTCIIDHWQCCLQKCNDSAFYVSQLNSNLVLRVYIQFNSPIRHYAKDTNSTRDSNQSGIPIPYRVKIFTVFNVAT